MPISVFGFFSNLSIGLKEIVIPFIHKRWISFEKEKACFYFKIKTSLKLT